MTRKLTRLFLGGCLIAWLAGPAIAAAWPTYRGDSRRSGASSEKLKPSLAPKWVFAPVHGPVPAWGDPQPKPVEEVLELPRMRFDDAFHVAAAGGMVYFGSSSESKVCALDAATGRVRWEFLTGGPVRLAPTVAGGRVYFGSDDGKVYCLAAGDGRLVWTFRAAPAADMVLGNGKMISRWPVRTGVVVDGGAAYFGAGVFPAEGLYLYAVNDATGKLIWKNDTFGAGGRGGISPQGYLLASKDKLFVPSGRAMPAAFSRKDGRFLFHRNFDWRRDGLFGGTYCLLAGDLLLTGCEQIVAAKTGNGQLAFVEGLPARTPSKGTRRMAVGKGKVYFLTGERAVAYDWQAWAAMRAALTGLTTRLREAKEQRQALADQIEAQKKPHLRPRLEAFEKRIARLEKRVAEWRAKRPIWQRPLKCCDSILLTDGMLLAGGRGKVVGLHAATGVELWSANVTGRVRGLAAANGRLLISTDTGAIHCFAPGATGKARTITPSIRAKPFPKDDRTKLSAKTAEKIVKDSGVRRGYALILGGTGRLALELARRTELMIYVVQPDAKKVAAARKALSGAALHGARVVVIHAEAKSPPCADYFANLIVWEEGFVRPAAPPPAGEVLRMLKPCGGVAYVGRPAGRAPATRPADSAHVTRWLDALRKKLADLGEKNTKAVPTGDWVKVVRGALPGAGSWTHQYANAANTACGEDQLVRGPLGILWYGEPGPGRMPSRHASAAAPLAIGGRMFVQGENMIMAYDAYNGLKLWERDIPGALRLGLKTGCSNLAADADSLFVAVGAKCLRLDAGTGKTLRTYKLPPPRAGEQGKRAVWGYVACANGLLYGSRGPVPEFAVEKAGGVFAREIDSGRLRWAHQGKQIMPATICIGGGRVFFVDRQVTPRQRRAALKGIKHVPRLDRRGKPVGPDVRVAVALNAGTGKEEWTRPQYVSDCVRVSSGGGELTVMYARNILLLCGQPWNGHFWRQFQEGKFSRRSLIALAADSGKLLWSGHKGYRSRPVIVGDSILAEPWAYDLKTGTPRLRVHPLTGAKGKWQMARPGHHCGNIAAGPHVLLFRSASTAYYDLDADYGTAHFGAQRPGCWINCIPANGLVLMPEASSGCICPYSVHCTIVFAPRKANRHWGMFSAAGAKTPVKRLALNLGAPGDRKDSAGRLWLGYPRPSRRPLVLLLGVVTQMAEKGGGYFRRNADFLKVAGAKDAWIYTSGCRGLRRMLIRLDRDGAPARRYTVRLYFNAGKGDRAGRRVFSVALQGREVLKDFDIFAQAGGPDRALVKQFKGIVVRDRLDVRLTPARGKTLLCGMEVVAE